MLMYEKFSMTWQCALTAQKANHIVGCIERNMASMSSERILPLCSCETPPGALCLALSHRIIESYVGKDL